MNRNFVSNCVRRFIAGCVALCSFARVGSGDVTEPLQIVPQTTPAPATAVYSRSGPIPPFPVRYARANSATVTLFYAANLYEQFTNAGPYTINGYAGFSLDYDGASQASGNLSLRASGTVAKGGVLGDSKSATLPWPLPLAVPSRAGFTSYIGAQTQGADLKTYASVSIVYDYTLVGQAQPDAIGVDQAQATDGHYVFDAAPTARWYSSPPVGGGVRVEMASAAGAVASVTLPTGYDGSFRLVADGKDYGVRAGGEATPLSPAARTIAVTRLNADGSQAGAMAFPLKFTFSQDTVDLALSTLTPLESWRAGYFGTTENRGAAADDANPAGDGLNNLLKYALNLNPLTPASSPVVVSISAGALRLTAPKNPNATDVTFGAQVIGDPGTPAGWSSSGVTVDQNTTTVFQAHDNTPVGTASRRFIRLQVARP